MLSDLITLVVGYVLYFIALCIITTRLAATWAREKKWSTDDYWMLVALVVLILRIIVSHLVLEYDTNNVEHADILTPNDIHRRELGSKMALVARCCYAAFIWSMKCCILALYSRIVEQLDEYRKFIKYIWVLLFLTFAGVMISTLLECRPFHQYIPIQENSQLTNTLISTAACTFAEAQLYTTVIPGACNIATDLILIIYPLPMVFRTHLPLRRKIQLYSLFSLGFFVILVSIFRLPFVIENHAIQRWRTLFASIEMLVACCVANAPVIYRIIKAQAKKHSSDHSGSTPRTPNQAYWFSANRSSRRHTAQPDEIEFSGLGLATTVEADPEWGIDASTTVDSGSVEGDKSQTPELQIHQPV